MKVLSIQLHSAPNDPPANYRRAFTMLEYGVELYQPDVIMLPEGFAGFRTEIPHREFAEPVPGPATDRFCEYSRRFNVMILFGLIRSAPSGEGIYNSIMIIDQGEVIGIYDKTHLVMDNRPGYKELYSEQEIFIPGKRLGVFDTRFGRIGVLICHDGEFPEPWRAMVLEGAEAIFWPMSAPVTLVAGRCYMPDGTRCRSSPAIRSEAMTTALDRAGAASSRTFTAGPWTKPTPPKRSCSRTWISPLRPLSGPRA